MQTAHDKTDKKTFQADVKTMRAQARQHIDAGAVTPSYGADADAVCQLLNESLATELVCVLRYKRHYFMANGIASDSVKAEFLEHATQEMAHADKLAERIVQLGGEPDFNPATLTQRSHAEYVEGASLREMIIEDLVAERVAIQSYTKAVEWLDGKDPVTHALVREILGIEQEHAEDMSSLLKGIPHDG
jgi:bacterioferritin